MFAELYFDDKDARKAGHDAGFDFVVSGGVDFKPNPHVDDQEKAESWDIGFETEIWDFVWKGIDEGERLGTIH